MSCDALIFGGSGTVGSAVVRALHAASCRSYFTYFRGEERAQKLAAECSRATATQIDLRQPEAIRGLFRTLDADGFVPNLFVRCAALSQPRRLDEISETDWDDVLAVGCRSAF